MVLKACSLGSTYFLLQKFINSYCGSQSVNLISGSAKRISRFIKSVPYLRNTSSQFFLSLVGFFPNSPNFLSLKNPSTIGTVLLKKNYQTCKNFSPSKNYQIEKELGKYLRHWLSYRNQFQKKCIPLCVTTVINLSNIMMVKYNLEILFKNHE